MTSPVKVLFVAWDSPHVTYLEGLFIPIFEGLTKSYGYEFHIIQFSWADDARIEFLRRTCSSKGIRYSHVKVVLWPMPSIGKVVTIFKGERFVRDYIKNNSIDVLMPRSTMPGRLALSVISKFPSLMVVFDADGLPIEERVDFAGLNRNSLRYTHLRDIERRIIVAADTILVRSVFAREYHVSHYGVSSRKIFLVKNGRDPESFKPATTSRLSLRQQLSLPVKGFLLVYCGSLGPQYGVDQMLYIHRKLLAEGLNISLLVLTKNSSYLENCISENDRNIIVKSVGAHEIPIYLAAADVAFALRKPTLSMQGVAPIKLGEYFLVGLPVVASNGIGDSETLLKGAHFAFLLDDYNVENLDQAVHWIKNVLKSPPDQEEIRNFGIQHFSVQSSVETYHQAITSSLK